MCLPTRFSQDQVSFLSIPTKNLISKTKNNSFCRLQNQQVGPNGEKMYKNMWVHRAICENVCTSKTFLKTSRKSFIERFAKFEKFQPLETLETPKNAKCAELCQLIASHSYVSRIFRVFIYCFDYFYICWQLFGWEYNNTSDTMT